MNSTGDPFIFRCTMLASQEVALSLIESLTLCTCLSYSLKQQTAQSTADGGSRQQTADR